MFIVLTNDDGIYATGLRAVYRALLSAGHEVQVIAPLGEQSAVGHSITVLNPLRIKHVKEKDFSGIAVSGTPTDCVKLGLTRLVKRQPDLVISGMNAGANVGPDILYSGTVAAATEAAAMSVPALAISHNSWQHVDVDDYATYAVSLIPEIPWHQLPLKRVVNLNLPACPFTECKGLTLCPQTDTAWNDWYDEREDPRGGTYWWITGEIPMEHVSSGTDKYMLEHGWATLTPLKFDFTDQHSLELIRESMPGAK